jgi:hypothetical protein
MAGQGVLPERGQPDRPVLAGHVVVRGLLPGRVTGPHARSRRPPACVRTPGIRGPARTSTWRSTVDGRRPGQTAGGTPRAVLRRTRT